MQAYQRHEKIRELKGKSKEGKKPWKIESRLINDGGWNMDVMSFLFAWRKHSSYNSEKRRDQALEDLRRKGPIGTIQVEYRKFENVS